MWLAADTERDEGTDGRTPRVAFDALGHLFQQVVVFALVLLVLVESACRMAQDKDIGIACVFAQKILMYARVRTPVVGYARRPRAAPSPTNWRRPSRQHREPS